MITNGIVRICSSTVLIGNESQKTEIHIKTIDRGGGNVILKMYWSDLCKISFLWKEWNKICLMNYRLKCTSFLFPNMGKYNHKEIVLYNKIYRF